MKPGYKTTEFWLTLLVNALGAITPGLDPKYQLLAGAFTAAAYAYSRGMVKQGAPASS